MVKRIQYEIDFKNNVSSVIKLLKEAQTAAQSIEDKEHSIKIGVDDKKLNNVLSKLEKTLTDFEKGTIDIKGLESLSKQLNDINVIAQKLSGIFDGIDTSSFSGLETSIGNIGKMIATLKDDIANVISEANKGNKTADIGGATKRINEEIKATEELAKAKKKLGQSEGKATERFADVERMNEVIDLFSRMESHLDSIKKALLDVGDGKEFSPLLKTINNVQSAVSGLEKSFSNMKLNMNFDIGNLNSEKADTKIAETNARRLAAYRDLFAKMKKTGKTTKDMVRFYEPENSSVTDLIGMYQNMIQEAEKKYSTTVTENGRNIKSNIYRDILGDNYKREVRLANDAFNRATKNKNKTSDFSDLFGKSNLSEIVSQLTLIVSKLDEIAVSASGLKDAFSNGINVTSSVDEIDKLTNRVKELEDELAKVKTIPEVVNNREKQTSPKNKTKKIIPENAERTEMYDVAQSAENAAKAKKEFIDANEKVQSSVDGSKSKLELEAELMESIAKNAREAANAKKEFVEANKKVKESADKTNKTAKKNSKNNSPDNSGLSEDNKKTLEEYQKKLTGFKNKSEKLGIIPYGFAQSDWYASEIKRYQSIVQEMETLDSKAKDGSITNDDISRWGTLTEQIKKTDTELKKFTSSQKGSRAEARWKEIDKITKYLKDNTRISASARHQLEMLLETLKKGENVDLGQIHKQVNRITTGERLAGREGQRFLDVLKDKVWYRWAAQIGAMFGISDIIGYFRQGIEAVKAYDEGLTKMSYTMDLSKTQLDNLGESVLETSRKLKSSVDNAMQVAQIYANMNTTAQEIDKLSQPTLIMSNLTGFDASTVADQIQSAVQQFDIAAEDSMKIADTYDYISRNISVDYAKGLESMSSGLQVVGSTAKEAGLNLEKTTAIIAKAVEKTRLDGSQVGNGLKTILTRLSKVGELSDEVDNESLSQASEALHKIGIEVYNTSGEYRKFDVVMGELSQKWDTLTDAEKSNISYAIAATRQTNLLSAILSNFSDSMELAEGAANASGSALENNEKYLESFSGQLQALKNEAKIAWINILDSDTLKGGVEILTTLLKILGELVDKAGLFSTIGIGAGMYAGIKNVGRLKMFSLF